MDAIAWMLLATTAASGCSMGAAIVFAELWRDAKRERDVFVDLHRMASANVRALMAGAPVQIVNVCRDCNRLLRPAAREKS